MVERQFEISKRTFIKKCGTAILLSSSIPAWIFIIWNYLSTTRYQGYYPAPVSILVTQLLCLPPLAYQLLAYFVSGLICISLFKRGWIRSAMTVYLGTGMTGWFVSTLFLSIMYINGSSSPAILGIGIAFVTSLPSLLLYLVFLFPKSAN